MWPLKKKPTMVALPMGKQAFQEFADAIYEGAQVPGLTKESAYFSIASMVLHKPSTESFASLEFFTHALRKAAANEVAASVIKELSDAKQQRMLAEMAKRQEAQQKALEASLAQSSEATPTQGVANEQVQQ